MVVHKNTRLMPNQRKALVDDYYVNNIRICDLAKKYSVTRPTVYRIIECSRNNDYSIHKSINKRFRCLQYGLKRLAKVEKQIEERLKKQAKRYNKKYPGEMFHLDTRRLPVIKGESKFNKHEYLFIAIDDFSRELYAAVLPDKTRYSAEAFLKQVLDECPYTIEQIYTDNGTEYRGNPNHHAFMKLCKEHAIEQRFTKVKCPQTNGKAERVIRTIIEMWYNKTEFNSRQHRRTELIRFVNYYNTVKPHKGIDNLTPMEKLINYFYPNEM